MKFNEAIKELEYHRGNRYILAGEELYLKELFVSIAKKIYPNHISLFPEDEESIKNAFCSDFFEGEKLVILYHFEEMKQIEFKNLLKSYSGALIALVSEEVNLKLNVITNMFSFCTPVSCGKMSEYGPDYPAWLISKASERNYLFIDDAESLMYRKVGPDMLILSNEIEKLILYKENSKTITPDDVEKVVTCTAMGSTYEILDNILRKDVVKSFKSLDLYLKNNDDLGELVYFLSHYFEKLYRMLLMSEEKMTPESIAGILNMHPFLIKTRYLPRAQEFGKNLIAQCLDNLCQVDVGLRTLSCKKILIDKFIFSFIT